MNGSEETGVGLSGFDYAMLYRATRTILNDDGFVPAHSFSERTETGLPNLARNESWVSQRRWLGRRRWPGKDGIGGKCNVR